MIIKAILCKDPKVEYEKVLDKVYINTSLYLIVEGYVNLKKGDTINIGIEVDQELIPSKKND
jgi:hypothetical protein